MSSDPSPTSPAPDPGLPPVLPPSGRQILQLFVVPALIVAALVGLFLIGPKLKSLVVRTEDRSGEQFLRDLDNPNAEVRYRAASDLAQVLLRKDELAQDVDFGLGLADRLSAALDSSAEAEKAYAAKADGLSEGERNKELKKLEADRNLITYLAASLGHMMVPVGVPLLGKMATQAGGMEPDALAERRGRALFALATLGDKLGRYDMLPDGTKDEIEAKLREASKGTSGTTARAALEHLEARRAGKPNTMGVAAVLAKTAADEDMYLRQLSAFASNHWAGTASEEKEIEDFLVTLSSDAGVGAEKLEERQSRNPDSKQSRAVTTRKGFNVQVQATLALARRGSPRVRMDVLEEMLDLDRLREVFIIRPRKGPEKPDEAMAAETALNALKAVAKLGEKRPQMKLDRLMPLIEALEKGDNVALAAQAKQTRLALKKG